MPHSFLNTFAAFSASKSLRSGRSATGKLNVSAIQRLSSEASVPADSAASLWAADIDFWDRKLTPSGSNCSRSDPPKNATGKRNADAILFSVSTDGSCLPDSNSERLRAVRPARLPRATLVKPRRFLARVNRDGLNGLLGTALYDHIWLDGFVVKNRQSFRVQPDRRQYDSLPPPRDESRLIDPNRERQLATHLGAVLMMQQ